MLDMKFLRENPDLVKENIKKKFQDEKLPLVDEVIELDAKNRAAITEASELRASRNALSKQIGMLMGQAKKDPSKLEEAEKIKATVKANADRLAELEKLERRFVKTGAGDHRRDRRRAAKPRARHGYERRKPPAGTEKQNYCRRREEGRQEQKRKFGLHVVSLPAR